jgi:hypothetical protein
MKRFAFVLLLSLFPLLAFAQGDPGQLPPPVQAVARYLELSPEQVEAWMGLLDGLHRQQRPLHEQVQGLEEELKLQLQQPEPDPAAVGQLVLEIQALRGQMRFNEEDYQDAFEDLLNEEQLEKLYFLRAASELAPLFPAFKETRLL